LVGPARRLQTLNEYIQDTEDLVNLKLDQHRNQLIGIDLILTSFSASVAMMTATAGYFGMNLNRWATRGGGGRGRFAGMKAVAWCCGAGRPRVRPLGGVPVARECVQGCKRCVCWADPVERH